MVDPCGEAARGMRIGLTLSKELQMFLELRAGEVRQRYFVCLERNTYGNGRIRLMWRIATKRSTAWCGTRQPVRTAASHFHRLTARICSCSVIINAHVDGRAWMSQPIAARCVRARYGNHLQCH